MMPRVLAHDAPETRSAVDIALETGQTIVFPTDTIYGIGGNPWDERSLERVRSLKGRPADQPFALLLPQQIEVERYAVVDRRRSALVARLLPGPFTLLLPAAHEAPASAVRDGKVGIRVPAHPFFRQTLTRPLFGTSVNRHGEPPLIDIDAIIDRFVVIDLIVTGPTHGTPSAILDLTGATPRLVRGELAPSLHDVLEEQ